MSFLEFKAENYPWPGRAEGSGAYGTRYKAREVTLGEWQEIDKDEYLALWKHSPQVTSVEQYPNMWYEEDE